ncbi:MAG: histidine kinase [Synergistaceae bacterium]|nr:histidine kinase [Synergistaceae bacterium]
MSNLINLYNFITGSTLLLSTMGLLAAAVMSGIDKWSKRFFIIFFASLLLSALLGFIEVMLYSSYPGFGSLEAVNFVVFMETVILSLPFAMPIAYLLHCCGESIRSSKIFYAVLALLIVFNVFLTTTLFSDVLYRISPEDLTVYIRGPLFQLMNLPLPLIALLNIAAAVQRRKQLSRKIYLSFMIVLLPMAVTLIVHMFIDVYPLISLCIVLSAISMYGLILSDQLEQHMRQQREIVNQRANIMILQMRPHFICNTMTSIYYLCERDPQKAKRVTIDFTNYLRRNFNAIASRDAIMFNDELEHTRAYLAVAQVQFEDNLFVEYEIEHVNFRVPPLTLQPIVENAVKHGLNPDGDPLRIVIKTRKTERYSEIIVEDNGSGFDADKAFNSHGSLANIKQRLEMMGGVININSSETGTQVIIYINC